MGITLLLMLCWITRSATSLPEKLCVSMTLVRKARILQQARLLQ